MGERESEIRRFCVPLSSEEEKGTLKKCFIYLMAMQLETARLSLQQTSVQALLTQTVLDKQHPTHRTVAK